MTISRLGFGAWAAGGSGWKRGWAHQDDGDSLAAIERALEAGMNWIDTAPAYGRGHSEAIVGQAIRGVPPAARPLLFTKCGAFERDGEIVFSLEPDSLRRELEASLERLGVDAVDLYQIHRTLPEAELETGWRALLALRDEGLVRHVGVSNATVEQLRLFGAIGPVETLQPAYSLMQPEAGGELLPYSEDHGVGVIVYSPQASGLLTGTMNAERLAALPPTDWRRNDSRFSPAALARSAELLPRLEEVGRRHDATPGQVAIAWTLANPAVDGAIVGLRNAAQVDGVLGADALELTPEDLQTIAAS